jgi:hypothetical protein
LTSEFCPRCNAIRAMVMTSSVRAIIDPDGEKKIIRTHHFHCETCSSFIRNEDLDEKWPNEQKPLKSTNGGSALPQKGQDH